MYSQNNVTWVLFINKKITDPYQILLTFPSYSIYDRLKVYLTKNEEENMKFYNKKKLLRDL